MTRIAGFGEVEYEKHQQEVSGQSPPSTAAGALPRSREIAAAAPGREPVSKYRNQPVVVDGVRFASKKEARQDAKLLLRQQHGQIRGLQRQVPFPFVVNGTEVAEYIADWTYWEGDAFIVHDAKGRKTDVYKLKKRLLKALFGLEIRET